MHACPAPSFLGSPVRAVALAAAALALAGCAAPAPEAWRVAPSYRVTHAGAGAGQGYLALARQYEGERRWQRALDAWRKAALEAPDDAEILGALGLAEAGQGFHDRAVAALRRAAALAPRQAALLNNLGYALLLAGRDDEARSVLREALALDPGHVQARANLSRLEPTAAVAVASVEAEPEPGPEPTPSAAPADAAVSELQAPGRANLDAVRIEITNGNGITGMAAWLAARLRESGLGSTMRLSNLPPYDRSSTVVYYRAGFAEQAREIARRMPQSAQIASQPGDAWRGDVRVLIGRDARHLAAQPPAGCAEPCRSAVAAGSGAISVATR